MPLSATRCAASLFLCAAIGCGGEGSDATQVQGVVTYEGKTIPFGGIFFLKSGERPLGGQIAADGAYQAKLPPGEYQVRIDATPPLPEGFKEGDPRPASQPRPVPERFANFVSSGLTLTVSSESPQQHDFKLP